MLSRLSVGSRLCFNPQRVNHVRISLQQDIMGESVLNNLTDLQFFILRLHKEDSFFSLCIKGGVLKIEHNTKNRYVHNHTEGFPFGSWFCRIIGL